MPTIGTPYAFDDSNGRRTTVILERVAYFQHGDLGGSSAYQFRFYFGAAPNHDDVNFLTQHFQDEDAYRGALSTLKGLGFPAY